MLPTPRPARHIPAGLHGHKGGFGVEAYPGLIPKDELKQLAHEHQSDQGTRSRRYSWGIFGRSKETIIKDAGNAGRRAHELKRGVHALSSKQHRENGRKGREKQWANASLEKKMGAAKQLAEGRGDTMWTRKESATSYFLSNHICYRRKTQTNIIMIQTFLNSNIHGRYVRNAQAVSCEIWKMQKLLKKVGKLNSPGLTIEEIVNILKVQQKPTR